MLFVVLLPHTVLVEDDEHSNDGNDSHRQATLLTQTQKKKQLRQCQPPNRSSPRACRKGYHFPILLAHKKSHACRTYSQIMWALRIMLLCRVLHHAGFFRDTGTYVDNVRGADVIKNVCDLVCSLTQSVHMQNPGNCKAQPGYRP